MTDNELKELVASIAIAQQETNKEIKNLAISQQETDRQFRQSKQQISELGKQIGGLGRKFGSFTEGLALPSMQKILQRQFKMEVISPSVRVKKGNGDYNNVFNGHI